MHENVWYRGLPVFGLVRRLHGGSCGGSAALVDDTAMGNAESRAERDEEMITSAAHGDEERLRELIALDGNINHIAKEEEYDRATPAIVAAQNNSAGCLRILLEEADLELDRADRWGVTPLQHAARHGHVECIEILLAAGADPSKQSADGSTALHMAVAQDQIQCVRALLQSAAAPFLLAACDADGRTALQLAENDGAADCEVLLREAVEARELSVSVDHPDTDERLRLLV